MQKIRVLSGIRASHSSLHIGNLLGSIEGMIKLQNDPQYETFYMVADLHGITTPFNPGELKQNRLEVAIDYLAAGIDPSKSTLFLQADVPEHAEFAYYLSSIITVKKLLHLPSFKGKEKEYKLYPDRMTAALLNYPVLMAADILLYKAELVPIGKDQVPHLEVAREIARSMNSKYGLNFPEPKRFSVFGENFVIPSILGGGKMSKSEPNGAIFLNDSLETIEGKVARIPTASAGGDKILEEGGIYSLHLLTKLFVSQEAADRFENEYKDGSIKYGDKKKEISIAIYERLKPIQANRKKFEENPELVKEILRDGAKKARLVAQATLEEVKEKMGLIS